MSEENVKNINKSDSNFALNFADHHILSGITFNGHYLINNNFSIPQEVMNLYIPYKLNSQSRNLSTYFTLNNCLFGSVKLTKNAYLDK